MDISFMKSNITKRFLCEICGQSYQLKRDLESHLVKHRSNAYPYICVICSKSFTQKNSLSRHIIMHTEERPYKCEICDKTFVHHSSYNFHSMCHSGARPHTCPFCDSGFKSTTHLKRHMNSHFHLKKQRSQEKPQSPIREKKHTFRCYICKDSLSDSFDTLHELEEHTKGHLIASA